MQKKLLTNGNAFKRTDSRWGGVVWYMDEKGERKRKSFSGTTKQEVNKKITDYIADFNEALLESDEAKKPMRESMQRWLEVFSSLLWNGRHMTGVSAPQSIRSILHLAIKSCRISPLPILKICSTKR